MNGLKTFNMCPRQKKKGDKEPLFLAEKNKIMATMTAATLKEEFEEHLRAVKAPQPQNIKDEEMSSSSNYLQSNEDYCYEILD